MVKLRLFDFETEDDDDNGFTIRMFAHNSGGETASIVVEQFKPFFYIKVDETKRRIPTFLRNLTAHLRASIRAEQQHELTRCYEVRRKKMRGFDNGKQHLFICVEFSTIRAFHAVKRMWYDKIQMADGSKESRLRKTGYSFLAVNLQIYESNIPPLLRWFHIQELSPSGWVELPAQHTRVQLDINAETTCKHNYVISCDNVIPLPNDTTPVPYLKASLDIEASSSHGDFPVPIKSYRKLANNVIDLITNGAKINVTTMKRMLQTAFQCSNDPIDGIAVVYPKIQWDVDILMKAIDSFCKYPTKPQKSCEPTAQGSSTSSILEWLEKDRIRKMGVKTYVKSLRQSVDDDATDEHDCDDDCENNDDDFDEEYDSNECGCDNDTASTNVEDAETSSMIPRFNVHELLRLDISKDDKIDALCAAFKRAFPPLEGDKTTFIGTTFMRSGQTVPHLEHCIVLDTCDKPLPETAVIESYATEREVLLAWTRLIQREDPDIMMGYNIFSFDYEFMFRRAQECECVEEFLKLSRMKNRICGEFDGKLGEYKIATSAMKLKNGNNNLNIIKMEGRIQIDMYYWLLRTEQLPSYKLDFTGSYFIGDVVKSHVCVNADNTCGNSGPITRVNTKNMTGLFVGNYVRFELVDNSSSYYKNGAKFKVVDLNRENNWFVIEGHETPTAKTVKWGIAKDDVTPKDIFRLTSEGAQSRWIVAKYCIQDCNIVHHLFNKIDVFTDMSEMARLCSIPMSYLMFRGEGIKLTSYVAKKCREMDTLMPVVECKDMKDGYDGAIVLDPKVGLYLEDPVCTGDYAGLYPSSMISENFCSSSKVWVKYYDVEGKLVSDVGEKDSLGNYIYDNIPGMEYVDRYSDTYVYKKLPKKLKDEKVRTGHRIARFAQYPDGKKAVLPAILSELILERKNTRKQIPLQSDDFKKNILNKRQKAIKVVANSVYGQTGAKTSAFCDLDIAASTTAMGKTLLLYSKRIIEECYGDTVVQTSQGPVLVKAAYVYGDTDSVFFILNLHTVDTNTPLKGKQHLGLTIEVAQIVTKTVTMFLKKPHDFEYEKTYHPFCLLSKKRYVGMLYETNPNVGYRNEMGIVLRRLDNAPIVKQIYGGVIDILMTEQNIMAAMNYVRLQIQELIDGKTPMESLIISKSIRSHYKKPEQIAHKVLADRMASRDSGNKICSGDRVPYVYIVNPDKTALQGMRIESPSYVVEHDIPIDYAHYITNQIMKPLLQVFGLVVEDYWASCKMAARVASHKRAVQAVYKKHTDATGQVDHKKVMKGIEKITADAVKSILFDEYLTIISNRHCKNRPITEFFGRK